MFNYSLNHRNKNAFIQVEKDYLLRIEKSNNKVLFTKEKKNTGMRKDLISNLVYSSCNSITANDINTQLANIKHIGFEVTDACNLECTYCIYGNFYNDYDERTCKQIDIRKAKLLIDYLVNKLNSPANYSSINEIFISFYGGEPLLNIDFIKELVFYTQLKQNPHLVFSYVMTTNAIYLKKYIDFLIKYDFSVTVSLDGSKDNNTYRKFHNGQSSFEVTYGNVKYIQENYADYFKKNIRFNTVLHNRNNIQETFSFFQQEFGMVPLFSDVNPAGVKPELKNAFEELIHEKPYTRDKKIEAEMKRILGLDFGPLRQLQDFIFHYSGNTYDDYNNLLVKRERVRNLPTATCIPFSKRIFMTVNNKILPCEKIGQQYSLGEVTDCEVRIDCEQIAKKYNSYYNSLKNQCNNCFIQKNCTQCMFEIPNLKNKPICSKMANKQMLQEYMQRNMKILQDSPILYKQILEEIIIMK